jgi:hypothetical protein
VDYKIIEDAAEALEAHERYDAIVDDKNADGFKPVAANANTSGR